MTEAPQEAAERSAEAPTHVGSMRRTALHGVRYLALAYDILLFGGLIHHQLSLGMDRLNLLIAGEYAVASLAIGLMLWWPMAGALVGLLTLLLPLEVGPIGAGLATAMATCLIVIARLPRKRWLVLAPYVAFVAVMAAGHGAGIALAYTGGLVLAIGGGIGARIAMAESQRRSARTEELRREAAAAGDAERARLASALQLVANEGIEGIERDAKTSGSDPAVLNTALIKVGDRARTALHEIRQLVSALRAGPSEQPVAQPSSTPPLTGKQLGRSLTTIANLGFIIAVLLSAGSRPIADTVAGLLAGTSVIALIWTPTIGVVLTLLTLGSALAGHAQEPTLLFLLLVISVLTPLRVRDARIRLAVILGSLGFAFAWMLVNVNGVYGEAIRVITAVIGGWAIGLTVRHFTDGRRREMASLQAAGAERHEALRTERDLLARELHDTVAHYLSLVSLQVLAHEGSDDAAELREALERCHAYARQTRTELTLLVSTMTGEMTDVITGPRATVGAISAVLIERGWNVNTSVATDADALDVKVRLHIVRILQEASTNILRYARPGGQCVIEVATDPDAVHVRVESDLPTSPRDSDHSSGFGLRGLAERAELLGGHLTAGPDSGRWKVLAEIPTRQAAIAASRRAPLGVGDDSWE